MHALLLLLHGDDSGMGLVYVLASVVALMLPVGVFGYIGYRLFRAYRKETQAESSPHL
jgi:hypothetical protein